MKYNATVRRISMLALLLVGTTFLVGPSCNRDARENYSKVKLENAFDPTWRRNAERGGHVLPDGRRDRITDICTDHQKIVCDWIEDPNVPRAFEYANGTNGVNYDINGPMELENAVRCVQGQTANGICEPHEVVAGESAGVIRAVEVADIGECSTSIDLRLFTQGIAENFQKQAADRLGEQRPPETEDVALWLDFVSNLKQGDWPVQAFVDTTISEYDLAKTEFVMRASYRVDGGIEWNLEPTWLGEKPGAQGVASVLQVVLLGIAFPFLDIGDCEKDRPMVVQLRGAFHPTPDGHGIGIKLNESSTCGPWNTWPCTWVSVLDWPARPLCNNRIKPRIESGFLDGVRAGFSAPGGQVACLTCKAGGGSALPIAYGSNGELLPIARVEAIGGTLHLIHFENPERGNPAYEWLKDRNRCGLDRSYGPKEMRFNKHGEHLFYDPNTGNPIYPKVTVDDAPDPNTGTPKVPKSLAYGETL